MDKLALLSSTSDGSMIADLMGRMDLVEAQLCLRCKRQLQLCACGSDIVPRCFTVRHSLLVFDMINFLTNSHIMNFKLTF